MTSIFNNNLFIKNRNRYAGNFSDYDFLIKESANLLLERLDVIIKPFETMLDYGCYSGEISKIVAETKNIKKLYLLDVSDKMLEKANDFGKYDVEKIKEFNFKNNSLDLILSNFYIFSENNPANLFKTFYDTIKSGGLFLGTTPCLGTLSNVAEALFTAEIEISGGVSPRIHPFPDIIDIGNTLSSAGFYAPIVDSYPIEIYYKDPMKIFHDLKNMSFANVLNGRSMKFAPKQLFKKACEILEKERDEEGGIKVVFNTCFITAWKD